MENNLENTWKPLVSEVLPDQFLFDLGAYLQTCAHIETTACDFICAVEGVRPDSQAWRKRFSALRKMTISDLLPVLRKSAGRLPEPLPSQFFDFVDWIKEYSRNRHIAVHGAFYTSKSPGKLRVIYTHKVKSSVGTEFHQDETELDRKSALEILHDADRVLRTLAGLVAAIDRGEVTMMPQGDSQR
ncbi:MAG: hypothetical protein U1E69_19740 [Tabrizicola sp.]|uniref:hypothetical protein n=1 Tax=Tabrizicola sp. TaxID=2005166 RepID=UPI002ABAAA59|nr:hypothetical protein [Tabrizicola sp.]MDZ4089031.1 hypothetical protein [Tabrizicola sp.]